MEASDEAEWLLPRLVALDDLLRVMGSLNEASATGLDAVEETFEVMRASGVWLFRDISWDPDFPTTARTAEDIYDLGQRQEVEGVIAINQWALLRLIEAVGDISSPEGDEPVTPRNLLEVLEEGTDRYGRAYMDLVLQGLLDRLNQPMSMPQLIRLAAGLFETLDRREMLLYFDDSDVQSVVRQWGWDGRVPEETADYLYVVDSNVGWSKSDRNVQRDISYAVDLGRGTLPRVALTISYSNHSGPGSPGCEPQWLNRGTDYSQLKNACYWNYFRVYAPQGSRLLSNTPLPLSEHTVSVEIGRGTPGHDTSRVSSSHNKTVFSGLTSIEAGARRDIALVYDLPGSVIGREGDTITYRLLVQKQPGVRQRGVSITVTPPEGYSLTASSLPSNLTEDGIASIDFVLGKDTLLEIEFKRSN